MKFGKRPARPGAIRFAFSSVVDVSKLPTPPAAFGHDNLITGDWGMLGNDNVGDCVWAGAAHEHMLWTLEGGAVPAFFTAQDVLSDYSAVTGYVPGRDDTDQGTDMQVAAAYRQKTGIVDSTGARHKIDAYVAHAPGNVDQLAVAAWIFGAVGVGVQCPSSMESQFDAGQPWDVVPNDQIVGGHYVPCVGRRENGNLVVVTWGRTQEVTPRFLSTYMDEGAVYLDLEFIRQSDKLSPENFDLELLGQYLKEIGQ